MVLFDSNIFIYAGASKVDISKIKSVDVGYASVSVIEVLGYQKITAAEQRKLAQIMNAYRMVDLDERIINRAVELRQSKKLSLGDAIVAATAIEVNAELWTVNVRDFSNINGLKVFNPIAS